MSTVVRNAMTVDVEDYFHVAALSSVIDRNNWSAMEYRAEANTHKLLALFAEHSIQATFFILGWVAKRSPALIRTIHAAGHEVACHGMSHQLVYEQSPKQFESETRESKALLEDIVGVQVHGYRAASWSITAKSLWALDIIHELGFDYDSSIFPIRHDLYGIPNAPTRPQLMRTPGGSQIVEFPPSTVDLVGLRLPIAGGGYFRLFPYWLSRKGLSMINRNLAQPFIFYLHPWEVDPGQPRVGNAGLLSTFRHYTNLAKTELRLKRLLSEFSFTTVRKVLAGVNLLNERPAVGVAAGLNVELS